MLEVIFIIVIVLGVFLVLVTILAIVCCVRRSKGQQGVVHNPFQPNNAGAMYPQLEQVTFMINNQGQTVPIAGAYVIQQPQIVMQSQSPIRNMSPAQFNSNSSASVAGISTSGSHHVVTRVSSTGSQQGNYQPLAQRGPETTELYSDVNPGFQNYHPQGDSGTGVAGDQYEVVDQGRDSYLEPISHEDCPRYLTPCEPPAYDYAVSDTPPNYEATDGAPYIEFSP